MFSLHYIYSIKDEINEAQSNKQRKSIAEIILIIEGVDWVAGLFDGWNGWLQLPPPSKVSLLNCGVKGYRFRLQLTSIPPPQTSYSSIKEIKRVELRLSSPGQRELEEQDSRNEVNKVEWMEWWRARGAAAHNPQQWRKEAQPFKFNQINSINFISFSFASFLLLLRNVLNWIIITVS